MQISTFRSSTVHSKGGQHPNKVSYTRHVEKTSDLSTEDECYVTNVSLFRSSTMYIQLHTSILMDDISHA